MKRLMVLLTSLLLGILALSACATAKPALASDTADCGNLPAAGQKIKIEKPWARATEGGQPASSAGPAMGGMGSGMKMNSSIKTASFMVIHNCGVQLDTLVKATSNLDGMTTLMNFEMKDGKSTMMDISRIDIPAGKKVELKSGGYHVMFMNLKKDLKSGDRVELTLSFKNAGDIQITLPVESPE